jgi:5-methyltetrahydrofolate--homocysteine methyltransferase
MGLTEHRAMLPAASVSGFFLAHPEARYFAVGKIGDDQVADLAARSGRPVDVLRRDLAPNL